MEHPLSPEHAAVADRARAGSRLIVRGMVLNVALAVVKVGGGVLGHAYALVADGVESLADVAISILVWAGFQWAAQPPDADHPYGHGKAEAVAGLFTAAAILGASLVIGWHAVFEIRAPQLVPKWWTLLILAAVVATKLVFSRSLQAVGHDTESTALGAEAWHHLSDALTSAAAFTGIAIAVVGGPGYAAADGWAALVAAVIIATSGMAIFRKALNEIMDIAVPAELENQVRAIALQGPGVAAVHKCRVRKSGLSYLVDIQIRVVGELSVREGHDIAHRVKDQLIGSDLKISDVSVHVEPA